MDCSNCSSTYTNFRYKSVWMRLNSTQRWDGHNVDYDEKWKGTIHWYTRSEASDELIKWVWGKLIVAKFTLLYIPSHFTILLASLSFRLLFYLSSKRSKEFLRHSLAYPNFAFVFAVFGFDGKFVIPEVVLVVQVNFTFRFKNLL